MNVSEMPVLELYGPPRKRGQIHGESLRGPIAVAIEAIKREIGGNGDLSPDAYFDEFVGHCLQPPADDARLAAFRAELQGVADGSNQRFVDIAALNLLDEELWYGRNRRMASPEAQRGTEGCGDRCSVIAIREDPDGRTLLAQNLDMSTWTEGLQAVLHVTVEQVGLEYYAFTTAGSVGACGINSLGLALCVNSVPLLNCARDGMPVAAIVREILECTSFESAVRTLTARRHASGQCYTVATRGQIGSFECSASGAVPYRTWGRGDRLVHTNHPLASRDTSIVDAQREAGLAMGLPRFLFQVPRNSLERQTQLEQLFGSNDEVYDSGSVASALASTTDVAFPICRAGSESTRARNVGYTTGSVIWELGGSPVAHVAPGPPDRTAYRTLRFT